MKKVVSFNFCMNFSQDGDYHLHILDFGSHFGAIGSFMNRPKRTDSMRKKAEEQKT